MTPPPRPTSARRASPVLWAAAVYNLAWGTAVVVWPGALFAWLGMDPPRYPEIWQCLGMVVGVYGVGYAIAASDPNRHWPIVLVGLLGKLLGPIGFVSAAWAGRLPWSFGVVLVGNDLIWWTPFTALLYQALRHNSDAAAGRGRLPLAEAVQTFRSQHGRTLDELSRERPVLVVFLRHEGCTFCRETLDQLRRELPRLAERDIAPAVVLMSDMEASLAMMARFGLEAVDTFSDPTCALYEAFELPRGTLRQLLAPGVWWKGFRSAIVERRGFGRIVGDGFRMPGAFVLRDGEIVAAQRAASAAESMEIDRLSCSLGDAAPSQDPRPIRT